MTFPRQLYSSHQAGNWTWILSARDCVAWTWDRRSGSVWRTSPSPTLSRTWSPMQLEHGNSPSNLLLDSCIFWHLLSQWPPKWRIVSGNIYLKDLFKLVQFLKWLFSCKYSLTGLDGLTLESLHDIINSLNLIPEIQNETPYTPALFWLYDSKGRFKHIFWK